MRPAGGWTRVLLASLLMQSFATVHAEVTEYRQDGVEIITSKSPVKPAASASVSASAAAPAPAPAASAARRAGPADPFAQAIRGDYRLRANQLTADGTPNDEADNAAHKLVRAQQSKVQAELKDNLKAFDTARRRGASRAELGQLQARIQANLDVIDALARSQEP